MTTHWWQWLAPLLVACAACDFNLNGGSSSEDCHVSPGGTESRTDLAVAGEIEIEARHASFASTTLRADASSFHIVIGDRTIRVFDDSPCLTCERGPDAGTGDAADAGDAGDANDASDSGATWTPPRAGDPRLVAVIHIDATALGTYDLARASGAYAEICNAGVMLDDPDGFFCAASAGLRSADRQALEGSLVVHSVAPVRAYALDARLGARGRLQLTFEETVTQSTYGPQRSCR